MLNEIKQFEIKKIDEMQEYLKKAFRESVVILINEFEDLRNEFVKNNDENISILIESAEQLKNKLEEKKNQVDKVFEYDLLYFHESNLSQIGQLNTTPNSGSMLERIKSVGKHKIDYKTKHQIVIDSFASINKRECVAIVLKCYHTNKLDQVSIENEVKLYDGKAMFTKKLSSGNLMHACLSEQVLFLIYKETQDLIII